MIRFKLRELIAERAFRLKRRVTLEEVAEATGIHRATLSKIAGPKPYNASTDSLDALCFYFQCRLEDVAEFVVGSEPSKAKDERVAKVEAAA